MSVGFGFSTGDFIAAIELVGTVVDALRSSGNAGAEYRELVSQLLSLEAALIQVKRLEFEESQYAEVIALRQAAAQCRRTIDAFWEKVKKYQPALGGTGLGSKAKDGWMRIKWAVCKKDDVAKFKADLLGHTESMQLLLVTVQMSKASISEKKQEERQSSLAGRVQEGYFNCMQRLMVVVDQGKQLLDLTSSILRTNVKVFQIVLQIQQMITSIPGQVERQQPVYMIDALGKTSPFHLEFVRSAEALVAVLKVNFKKYGNGTEKIERGEFVIQDAITKRDIDLNTDWEVCFSPGQRVMMSMILTRAFVSSFACPKCHAWRLEENNTADTDIDCPSCGLTYRRVIQQANQSTGRPSNPIEMRSHYPRPAPNSLASLDSESAKVSPTSINPKFSSHSPISPPKRKFGDYEFSSYRRVRIRENPQWKLSSYYLSMLKRRLEIHGTQKSAMSNPSGDSNTYRNLHLSDFTNNSFPGSSNLLHCSESQQSACGYTNFFWLKCPKEDCQVGTSVMDMAISMTGAVLSMYLHCISEHSEDFLIEEVDRNSSIRRLIEREMETACKASGLSFKMQW